jgi:anti-anti-sigma factor
MFHSIVVADRPDGIRLHVAGVIDFTVADQLHDVLRAVLELSRKTVEVDCQDLRILDCSGVTALIRARNDALRRGQILFVSNPRGVVRQLLEITGTLPLLTVSQPFPDPRLN